jgi:hypothetical protein
MQGGEPEYLPFLGRLGIDIVAIAILAYGLYFRRHGRPDLMVAYVTFNVALLVVISVIAGRELGVGFGFGLFAILSIIRLRSEEFSNREIGYFFSALALALVNGIDVGDTGFTLMLDVVIVAAVALVDRPGLLREVRQQDVVLDTVHGDEAALLADLQQRLGGEIVSFSVRETDYVRETTALKVRWR